MSACQPVPNGTYSSSRLVTLYLLFLVLPPSDELVWGEVGQGLVRAYGIVGVLPSQEFLVQGGHLQGKVGDLIELLRMGALGALHRAIEFGGAGGAARRGGDPGAGIPFQKQPGTLSLRPPFGFPFASLKGFGSGQAPGLCPLWTLLGTNLLCYGPYRVSLPANQSCFHGNSPPGSS